VKAGSHRPGIALGARLHELMDFADKGGADAHWLEETLELLVAAILGRIDPRRQRSLERAADIERAAAQGASSGDLADRFGLSPSQIRRLRALREQARMTSCALFQVERKSRRTRSSRQECK
jgi:hypothetical protein